MRRLGLGALAALALAGCKSSTPLAPPSDAGEDAPLPHYDFSGVTSALFSGGATSDGGAWTTDGVVIMVRGHVVFEQYANGYTATSRHILYSASKSIGSALVGIAIDQSLMKLGDSVCAYITQPAGAAPTLCDTTIEHLLHMASGLAWIEDYGTGADPTTSNVLQMLYGNQTDMGAYVAEQPRAAAAGSTWLYSSGDANLLALALKGALKGQDVRAWAESKLFQPAHLASAVFEEDRSGTLVFSSSLFLTPRDMAAFGQLYLTDGMSGQTRVLPAGWVDFTKTPAPPVAQPTDRVADAGPGNSGGSYGAMFWLNATSATAPQSSWLYPQAPVDTFSAEGHWGQKIMIVPSRQLVIARVGNDRDPQFDPGPMVQAAVAAIDAAASAAGHGGGG